MTNKPISKGLHNLTDYAFGVALATIPQLLGADKKTVQLYRLLALEVFLYSAFSKHPYALKPLIPTSIHQKIDFGNIGMLGLLYFYRKVRKNKPVSVFNLGMMALGITTVLFTKWKTKG